MSRWKALAARVDEMTLRQRALLFTALSLLLAALAHVTLIDPILSRQRAYIDTVNRNQSQIVAARAQVESILKEQSADPEEQAIKVLEQQASDAERALTSKRRGYAAAARLPTLVKQLLGPNRQVKLESLKLLPAQPVGANAQLYRHGVEVALTGGYFELLQYLAELEKLSEKLLWGGAVVEVRQYPEVRLTFQVHTLSSQPALGL